MRIISGCYRGRSLNAPDNLPVRPTTDFAKTGLFNVLNNRIDYPSCRFLDLFSGTGNISYEFVSRGCRHITCVDVDKRCLAFTKKTMEQLKFENLIAVNSDVISFLEKCVNQFHVVFADPPYSFNQYDQLVELIFEKSVLLKGGWLIVEHSSDHALPNNNRYTETKKYGHVAFSFYT